MLTRLLGLIAAGVFLGVAFAIRALDDGALEQYSGTALYASLVYAGLFVLWPRLKPVMAGAGAIVFCWVVEISQLTGIPAALSAKSYLARLALGVKFDPVDLAWYPVGVIPLVVIHQLVRAKRDHRVEAAGALGGDDAEDDADGGGDAKRQGD